MLKPAVTAGGDDAMQLRTQKANLFRWAKRFSQRDMAVQSCTKSSVGIRMRKSLCPSNHAMQLPRPCTESTAQSVLQPKWVSGNGVSDEAEQRGTGNSDLQRRVRQRGVSPFLCTVQQWNRMAEDLEARNMRFTTISDLMNAGTASFERRYS